ncbi:MAG: hypothetical protein D8M59_14005 [Planctomycetes bacterium]|nr:hypothetical protein [Planctomycetota bacterium]NOG55622.1 hypothetical protein [Planctomycetota bacterium]
MLKITDDVTPHKRGRLNRSVQQLMVDGPGPETAAPSPQTQDGDDTPPIPFERRYTDRVPTNGWAHVICQNPYHTFLGGSMQLADVSDQAVGLISDNRVAIGDLVEVRLAPFRCRGRIGRVIRCDQVPSGRRVPTVRLDRSHDDTHDAEAQSFQSDQPTRYKVAVHFGRSVVAA